MIYPLPRRVCVVLYLSVKKGNGSLKRSWAKDLKKIVWDNPIGVLDDGSPKAALRRNCISVMLPIRFDRL